MQRITDPTAAASLPAPPSLSGPAGYFTEQNPVGPVAATNIRGWWLNMVQEEIAAIALAGGGSLDTAGTVNNQCILNIIRLFTQRSNFLLQAATNPGYLLLPFFGPVQLIAVFFRNIVGVMDSTGKCGIPISYPVTMTSKVLFYDAIATNEAANDFGQIVEGQEPGLSSWAVDFYDPAGSAGEAAGCSGWVVGY